MVKRIKFSDVLFRGIMWMACMICLVPLLWVVRTAFIPSEDALDLFAIVKPTFANIQSVFSKVPFFRYYGNTIFITGLVIGVQFVLITFSGYAFARLDFYGSKILFVIFLAQMMIAPEVLILPNYSFMVKIGLNNTRIGIALPFFASAMGTLIVRQSIKTIPYELEEAAQVEGASFLQIIRSIYVPLLKSAYVAFGMISVSYQWNNFLWPLVMTDSVEKRPLSLGLAMFAMSFETGAQWSDVSAATLLVCAPIILLFVIFQKQFIESFVQSGIK